MVNSEDKNNIANFKRNFPVQILHLFNKPFNIHIRSDSTFEHYLREVRWISSHLKPSLYLFHSDESSYAG